MSTEMKEQYPAKAITAEDIDAVMKQMQDDAKKPTRMAYCPSCGDELPYIFTDYITGQCEECFQSRKPWCSSSPVRDVYFMVVDAE